jgi:hypothetical protein
MKKLGRQSVSPEIVAEEARLLRAIWDATPKRERDNQAQFGKKFQIGTQSAVGSFLRGESTISSKAARGFAAGLKCAIADFSPRLAKEAELNARFANPARAGQSPEIAELTSVVERLASSGRMQLTEVQAMIAMLKAREDNQK